MKKDAMKKYVGYWRIKYMTREMFDDIMNELFEEAGIGIDENNEGEADSLTYMSLITSIEEEFDVQLPDEFLVLESLKNIELFKSMIFELL